jgi:hypothetical protein
MSALTQFFVATPEELASHFSGWLAVRSEPTTCEMTNPFTGKKSVVTRWLPAVPPPVQPTGDSGVPNLEDLARVGPYRVDHVKLARLFVIMRGGALDNRIRQLTRPVLIHPAESEEMGLHLIDDELTVALAEADDANVAKTAATWAQAEELQRDRFTAVDCEAVLRELRKLARQAHQSQSGLYFFWSL